MPTIHTYTYKRAFCTFPSCAKTNVCQSHISAEKLLGACAKIPDIQICVCCSHLPVCHSDSGRNTKSPCEAVLPSHIGTFHSGLPFKDVCPHHCWARLVQLQEVSVCAWCLLRAPGDTALMYSEADSLPMSSDKRKLRAESARLCKKLACWSSNGTVVIIPVNQAKQSTDWSTGLQPSTLLNS